MNESALTISDVIFGYVCLGVSLLVVVIVFLRDIQTKKSLLELEAFVRAGVTNKEPISFLIQAIDSYALGKGIEPQLIARVVSKVTGIHLLSQPQPDVLWKYIDLDMFAMWYAKNVKASDCSREFASSDPCKALLYAQEIDKCPHEVTREMASWDPHTALDYALKVDKCPHEFTRNGACNDSETALDYALKVDKCPHIDTYRAVNSFLSFRKGFFAGKEVVFTQHLVNQYEDLLGKPEVHK